MRTILQNSMSKTHVIAMGALLLIAPKAWALSCDEIMNMVRVNVPVNIVIQTMEGSGSRFSPKDLQCLTTQGAPSAVLDAANRLALESSKPEKATTDPDMRDMPARPTFDEAEMLGAELPEEDDEPNAGGSPQIIDQLLEAYRAKKYLTASKGLYELLEDGTYPDQETKLRYFLAKSLYDLKMYHSAQNQFMSVVRKGPNNPYFKYALPRLVAIAKYTGNDYELLRIVQKIAPEAFPRQAQNHLNYLLARKLYDAEELSEAAGYFQQISTKSDLFLPSKYFEGVIHNERGKLRSAVKSFRDVYQAELKTDTKEASDRNATLKDLSLLNIARIYFGLERFDQAENYYSLVDRNSAYWPESLFERGWTNFYRSDLNLVLGLLVTMDSPHYADTEFIPEATILKALVFFSLCEYGEVDRILLRFQNQYGPMKTELKSFLDQYKTEEGRMLADQAFDAYFSDNAANRAKESTLSKALFSRTLRNRDLASLVHHMDIMDEESSSIDAQKGIWKQTIGQGLKNSIERDRQRYKRRAGTLLLQELLEQYRTISDLLMQGEIISFEVVDAQREEYEFKVFNPDVEAMGNKKIDFATSKEIIYWPFNGEFWKDELGYYRYTEQAACK